MLILLGIPGTWLVPFLAAFKFLSFGFDNLTLICLHVDFFEFILLRSLLKLLDMHIHLLPQLWEALGHCFFIYFSYFFFSFPSEIPTVHLLVCLMIIQFLQDLFIYLCFCLFVCFLSIPKQGTFNCLIFKFADPFFFLLKYAFDSSSKFFISIIVL